MIMGQKTQSLAGVCVGPGKVTVTVLVSTTVVLAQVESSDGTSSLFATIQG
jgi:hypothetical protein